jgi:hypothetical protein
MENKRCGRVIRGIFDRSTLQAKAYDRCAKKIKFFNVEILNKGLYNDLCNFIIGK